MILHAVFLCFIMRPHLNAPPPRSNDPATLALTDVYAYSRRPNCPLRRPGEAQRSALTNALRVYCTNTAGKAGVGVIAQDQLVVEYLRGWRGMQNVAAPDKPCWIVRLEGVQR